MCGGGCAARLFILLFLPCSADHERDQPPCKVLFFGLAINTLNVRKFLREFHRMIRLLWHQRKVPQRWRDDVIKVLHKKDRIECGKYRPRPHPGWRRKKST